MAESVDILIENGTLVTMNSQRQIIQKGTIAIKGNLIVDIGSQDELANQYIAEETIDATGMAVLPGFINTHTHLFQTIMRSVADDRPLFPWLQIITPIVLNLTSEDVYYSGLAGALESLRSGVTTILDQHIAAHIPKLNDEPLKAMRDIGVRGILARGNIVAKELDPNNPLVETEEGAFKDLERMVNTWHNSENGRLMVWNGTSIPLRVSDEFFAKCVDLSEKYDIGMTTHLSEVKPQVDACVEQTGMRPFEYLYKRIPGFLSPRQIAVHCVWLSPEEINILAKTGTHVSHNPISNGYLASGIAPVPEMIQQGVNVTLGLDGPASNNGQDMMECLKTTVMLHKASTSNATSVTAEHVLEMATINGAKAINKEHELGSLEKGKLADVILFNYKLPNMTPLIDIVSQIVYCGKAENIDSVIVNGKIILKERKLTTMDDNHIMEKTQELADSLMERSELETLRKKTRRK
ncbi:MAG: amidohydrolase family protein [Candidatus Ranarchaeia archaeon]|jgi:5-methylthioadenosine/S-adenosylhomocysteine deaminase